MFSRLTGLFLAAAISAICSAPASSLAFEFTAENSHSSARTRLPPGTTMISSEEFARLADSRGLLLDAPAKTAEAHRLFQEASKKSLSEVTRLLQRRPDLLKSFSAIPEGYTVPWSSENSRGQRQTVLLNARDTVSRDILGSHQRYQTKDNAVTLYSSLRQKLGNGRDLPTVDVRTADREQILAVVEKLIDLLERKFGRSTGGRPPQRYGQCAQEEGAANVNQTTEGDQTGLSCNPHANGLLRRGDWTLKFQNTCVRNQGDRGTCVAFGITAAVESLAIGKFGRWLNLSEQHFYNTQKMVWFPVPPNFGDGLVPLLTSGISLLSGYPFHFENRWHYNPSKQREVIETLPIASYIKSCNNYGGRHCSDTNHQGRLVCTQVAFWNFCGYDAPMPASTGIRISGTGVIFDLFNPDASLANAQQFLRSGVPLVLGIQVTDSFDEVGSDGYVPFVSNVEESRGGHAVLLTGWIPNNELPSGVAAGSGGGYFIIKNSWGKCEGDAGYYYLPYNYVKRYGASLTTITDLSN